MDNRKYLKNPESSELQNFIDNSVKGVYGQYSDKGICFFPRDKYTIDEIHSILDTRGDVKPLCIVIDKAYRMSYTDTYRGVGVRNIAELAYMYNYLKKYRFLDQKFINNVYKGIRYVIDLKNNESHPRRKEAVDIIHDHPLLRKFLKGVKVGLTALVPILGSIGLIWVKRRYGLGENMNNKQLIESLDYQINRVYLTEENLIDKLKDNLRSYRDTQIKPWVKAKSLIDKAKEDYKIQHDYASTKHPFIIGLQDAIVAQGKIVLTIVLGLLLIYMHSPSRTYMHFTDLLKLIFKNIKPGLLLESFAALGITPLYYKLRAKYMSESLEITNEDRPKHPYINTLKRTFRGEKKHLKRGLAGAGVGGALGAGAGYLLGKKYRQGKKVAGALAGVGGLLGAHAGGIVSDAASRDADRIKKEYANFQKKKKK